MGNFTGAESNLLDFAILMGAEIAGFFKTIVAVPIAGTIKGTVDAIRNLKAANVVPITIPHDSPRW